MDQGKKIQQSKNSTKTCTGPGCESAVEEAHTAVSQPATDSYMKLIHSTAAPFPTVRLTDFCAEVGEFHLLYRCSWKDFTHKLFPVHNTYSK